MRLNNLTLFTIANSVMHFAWGLIGPFYFLYINQLGGNDITQFGISFGILSFATAFVSLFAGRYSDKLGRKPFLIATSLLYSILIYSYTLIDSIVQLYVIQAVFGMILAIEESVYTSFLGDITKKRRRGFQVGVFKAFINIFSGLAVILGGFLIDKTNFEIIFYIGSSVIAFGTIVLLGLKETVKKRK